MAGWQGLWDSTLVNVTVFLWWFVPLEGSGSLPPLSLCVPTLFPHLFASLPADPSQQGSAVLGFF